MIIHGIQIGDTVFEAQEFGGKKFLKALKKRLQEGASPTNTEKGVALILGYKPGTSLTGAEQVQVALALTNLHAKAIIEGEIQIQEKNVSNEVRDALRNFCIPVEKFMKQVVQESENTLHLVHKITGTSLGIFLDTETSEQRYIVFDRKNPSEKIHGELLDTNGNPIRILGKEDEFYAFVENNGELDIYFGAFNSGIERIQSFPGIQSQNVSFVTTDTIFIQNGDEIQIINLQKGVTLFDEDIEEKMIHERIRNTTVDKILHVSSGEIQAILLSCFVEDNNGDTNKISCLFDEIGKHTIRMQIAGGFNCIDYKRGMIVILYNSGNEEYTLIDCEDGVKIDGIQIFRDLNGKIYYEGETYYKEIDGELHFFGTRYDPEGNITNFYYTTQKHVSIELPDLNQLDPSKTIMH